MSVSLAHNQIPAYTVRPRIHDTLHDVPVYSPALPILILSYKINPFVGNAVGVYTSGHTGAA